MRDNQQIQGENLGKAPFAIAIPTQAPRVLATEEDMTPKRTIESAYFDRNPDLDRYKIYAKDTNTTVPDVKETPYQTTIHDGNEVKTIADGKQDTGTTSVWDNDDAQ